MKTRFVVIILVLSALMASWCTTTDEAIADNVAHDIEHHELVKEVGENAASFLMNH